MKQKVCLEIENGGKNYQLICDSDSPLGGLHDALMHFKGTIVERMIAAQKEEQAASDAQLKEELEPLPE